MSPVFQVFVSAVSTELGSYRADVARVLRRKGIIVQDQDHFRQGDSTLLEALREYIRKCDAVILLIGNRAGSFPSLDHLQTLGENEWAAKYLLQTKITNISYTQWEYFLAKQHNCSTYVFFTEHGFLPDVGIEESHDSSNSQAAFRDWIDEAGEHRNTLTTRAKLVEDVLVLPFPDVPLVKPNNLPFASIGDFFRGRGDESVVLNSRLLSSSRLPRHPFVLHGLPGVGKTRLAIEFACKHLDEYVATLFLNCENVEDLELSFSQLCESRALNLPEKKVPDREVQAEAVIRWFQSNDNWLLIVDNVDSLDAAMKLERMLPRLGKGQLLITSQHFNWNIVCEKLEVKELDKETVVQMFLDRTNASRRRKENDEEIATILASEFDGLPLAIEQAAVHVCKQKLSLPSYLELWRSDKWTLLSKNDVRAYSRSITTSVHATIDRLSVNAKDLLFTLAWMAPRQIPECLVCNNSEHLDALVELHEWSIITRMENEERITFHRILQDIAKQLVINGHAPGLHADHFRQKALLLVLPFLSDDPRHVQHWESFELLFPHALAIIMDDTGTNFVDLRIFNYEDITDVLMSLALYAYYSNKNLPLSLKLCEVLLKLVEETSANDRSTLSRALHLRGALLVANGEFDEAEYVIQNHIELEDSIEQIGNVGLAHAFSNLCNLYMETSRIKDSEKAIQKAIRIFESARASSAVELGSSLNTLAQIYQRTNRVKLALQATERALRTLKESKESGAVSVLETRANYAMLLLYDENFSLAHSEMTEALSEANQIFGPENPFLVGYLRNLAKAERLTGDLHGAESSLRKAIAIEEQHVVLSKSLAVSYNEIGLVLTHQKRFREAETYLRKAISIQSASHNSIDALTYFNLADLLATTDRLPEGIENAKQGTRLLVRCIKENGLQLRHTQDGFSMLVKLLQQRGASASEILSELRTLGVTKKDFDLWSNLQELEKLQKLQKHPESKFSPKRNRLSADSRKNISCPCGSKKKYRNCCGRK